MPPRRERPQRSCRGHRGKGVKLGVEIARFACFGLAAAGGAIREGKRKCVFSIDRKRVF